MKRKKLKKESFMKSVVVLMVSQVFVKVLGLVYKLYLTNKEGFGDKGNAIYSSGFQVYALLLTISAMGVPNALSKLVSERVAIGDHRGAHKIFKIALLTFSFIGFCCSMILFLGAHTISNTFLQIPEAEMALVALSPSIFFVSVIAVIKGYFNGRENITVTAKSQSLEQVFKTVFTILIVNALSIISGMDTVVMAAGANLATSLSAFTCFMYLVNYYMTIRPIIANEIKNTVNYKPTRIRRTIKQILFVSIPMSLSAIFGALNRNIDSMTVVRGLKKFMTEESAKIQYGILSGKVETLVTIPMSFNMAFATALVPSISKAMAKNDKKTVEKRIKFSLLVSILIGMPCMVGMILYAKQILLLLFPNAATGEFIYQISCLGIIFILMEQTVGATLHGIGNVFVPAIALAIGGIVKLALNLILVPLNNETFILGGTAGAAFSSVICHIVVLTIELTILKKKLGIKFEKNKFIIKPLIAVLVMAISSKVLYTTLINIINANMSLIITMLFSIIVYTIMIIILKTFSKNEIYMIPYGSKFLNKFQKEKTQNA